MVQAFYAAINAQDYRTAWDLGGDNLGESYDAFTAGFSDTLSDTLTVTGGSGSVVQVDLVALHTDGTTHEYSGSYTVEHAVITRGSLHALADASTPSGARRAHALCTDGTVSYSTHDAGTCSHHGGVAIWYWH